MNSDDGITPKKIANKMRDLVNDLLGPSGTDNLADLATQDNSGTDNAATATTNGAQSRRGEINNANIVHSVESLLACADIIHLSKLALDTSSFLDTNDQGSTSNERKVKSLRSRWICSSGSKNRSDTNSSKEGMGTAATVVTHKYRVLAVFEKSYNKWFMTGEKKKWSPEMAEKEKKKYRVEARMLKEDVLGYEDIDIHENDHRRKDIICIADGSMVVAVVGKLTTY
eukprot:scaffold195482_cov45-Attheya_sp.AAC.2